MTAHERFEEIYRREAGGVLSYARYRVGAGVAEDIVAETFTIAWQKFEQLPDPPRPWLLGTARRVSANHLRAMRAQLARQTALDDLIIADTNAGSATERVERRQDLIAALKVLPPLDREAVLLVTWHDLTHADAATVMDCSITAFAVRLHRARRRLARTLSNCERYPTFSVIAEENR